MEINFIIINFFIMWASLILKERYKSDFDIFA